MPYRDHIWIIAKVVSCSLGDYLFKGGGAP